MKEIQDTLGLLLFFAGLWVAIQLPKIFEFLTLLLDNMIKANS